MALAVLLPLAFVGGYLRLIQPPEGAVEVAESARELDQEMAERSAEGVPKVLLIGSSHLGRGIEPKALARALGLAPREVHALWRSNMQPPHWYAILKNRVYGNGHEPPVVVVVSTLRRTLQVEVEGGMRTASLVEQLGEVEPVIDEKVFKRRTEGGGAWGLVKARRTRFRESLTDGIKGWVTAAFFLDADERAAAPSPTEAGIDKADAAMERLLGGEGAKDLSLQSRVIPIVEDVREVHEDDKALLDPVDTLVPDFIDLVQEHGGKIVFVDLPVAPKVADHHEVDPDQARAFVELLNERGAGFIDLQDLAVENHHFRDPTHLNTKGRDLATAALAEALAPLNLFSADAEVPQAELSLERLLRPVASREGEVPELAQEPARPGKGSCAWEIPLPGAEHFQERNLKSFGLGAISPVVVYQGETRLEPFGTNGSFRGDTCKGRSWNTGKTVRFTALPGTSPSPGDFRAAIAEEVPSPAPRDPVHWAFPGTTLTVTMPASEALADETAEVRVVVRQAGKGALPVLEGPGGASVPFEKKGSLITAALEVRPGTENWPVHVRVPEDGAAVVVAQLEVTALDSTSAIIGVEAAETESVSAFARKGPFGLSFKTDPPMLGPVPHEPKKVSEVAARVQLPELEVLSMTALRERLLVNRSPLMVYEDGKALPGPNTTCLKVRKDGGGTFCHHDERLFLSSAAGGLPGANGRTYTLGLSDQRKTGEGWLFYPGDIMHAPVPPPRLDQLPGRVHGFHLAGAVLGEANPGDQVLRVRIFDRNTLVYDQTLTAGELTEAGQLLPLPEAPALGPGSKPVFRIQSTASAPYLWVKNIELVHRRRHTGGALPGAAKGPAAPDSPGGSGAGSPDPT